MPSDVVRDNRTDRRYELAVGDGMATVTYGIDGDVIALHHAEVPESARGQGVAGRLIAEVLADARRRGLSVTPHCPAVASYMRRHGDVQDLLTNEGRAIVARTD